jgi:hypothetical protein
MTRFLITLIVICLILLACAYFVQRIEGCESYTDEEIVNAIWCAEGKYKADYLYGIRSVKYKDEAEARQICLNSVRNNKKRWAKAGKSEDFIVFMGKRYSPPKINPNWVRNVNYFLYRREE